MPIPYLHAYSGKFAKSVLGACLLACAAVLFSSGPLHAQTIVDGWIGGETWTAEGSPYILVQDIFLDESTLIIEPGVAVKSNGFGLFISAYATLVVSGTAEQPVVFTSLFDREYGGDTSEYHDYDPRTYESAQLLPDIVVSNLLVDPPNPTAGQSVRISVTVSNQGAGPTGPFSMAFYVDPVDDPPTVDTPPFMSTNYPGLDPGASQVFNQDFTVTSDNPKIYVWADRENQVSESNTTNNLFPPAGGDPAQRLPAPGDWKGIEVNGWDIRVEMNHALIRYAQTGISTNQSDQRIQNVVIEHSLLAGIEIADDDSGSFGATEILTSTIRETPGVGLRVSAAMPYLWLHNNTFQNNEVSIILSELGNTEVQVRNNRIEMLTRGGVGIQLDAVGPRVMLEDNTIIRSPQLNAYAAIEVSNSRPQFKRNTVRGFIVPVFVTNGYPNATPVYESNHFEENQYGQVVAVKGELSGGVWADAGGYAHIVAGAVEVRFGEELIFPPGAVVKFDGGGLRLASGAQLTAKGTLLEPVVFTSIRDNEYGQMIGTESQAPIAETGFWDGIIDTSAGGAIRMEHAYIRYASTGVTPANLFHFASGRIEHSYGNALLLNPLPGSAISVTNSLLRYNGSGITLEAIPAQLHIRYNSIVGNREAGFRNRQSATVDVRHNWWGSDEGPGEPTIDPETGERSLRNPVEGNVNHSEQTQMPPDFDPVSNLGGAAGDAYEPDNRCQNAQVLRVNDAPQLRSFHVPGDIDWAYFQAAAGATYLIEVQTPADSRADVNMAVHYTCTTEATEADVKWEATFTPDVRLRLTVPSAGPVYIRLTNFLGEEGGEDHTYRLSVREERAETGQKGALILLGGRLKAPDRVQANIDYATNQVYDLFKASGYSDEDIYYLSTDASLPGYDAPATAENLRVAITEWAVDKVGPDRPLTLYLIDHGHADILYLDELDGQRVSPVELDGWLSLLEAIVPDVKITVIIEACYAGSFIGLPTTISKPGRLIIASTDSHNVAYASDEGAHFSDRFFTSLRQGYSLTNSFWDARYSVRRLYRVQNPWIDANGNGIPNEIADGADFGPHEPGLSIAGVDLWAPYIVWARTSEYVKDGVATFEAEVRDDKAVQDVWMLVYPPSFGVLHGGQELAFSGVRRVDMTAAGNDLYRAAFGDFTEEGIYRFALFAQDDDKLNARLTILEVDSRALTEEPEPDPDFNLFVPGLERP